MRPIVRYSWFVLAFNVLVILMGALVRATGSGAGCGRSWPTCGGDLIPELEGATAIEFGHRAVSGIALVLVAALVVWVWRSTTAGHPARLGVGLSMVAIVGEALVGAMIVLAEWVAEDASLARTVAVPLHLVNTLLLLAALTLTILWLQGGKRLRWSEDKTVNRALVAGLAALVLISASGAVTALADTLFPKDGTGGDVSNLLTSLRIVHPILAVVAATLGFWVGGRTQLPRSKASSLMPWLVFAMLISGVVNVLLGVPVWMQLVHLLLADALWVAFVWTTAVALQPSEVPSPV